MKCNSVTNNEGKRIIAEKCIARISLLVFSPHRLVTVSRESCFVNDHVRLETHGRRQIQNANYEIIIQQYMNNGERAERHARGAYRRRKTRRALSLLLSVSLQR